MSAALDRQREQPSSLIANFETVHRRVSKTITSIVRRRLSAHEDREDVVQEVLLQVFLQSHTLRDPSCLEIWAARVTSNKVNAHLRRRVLHHVSRDPDSRVEGRHDEDWDQKLLVTHALAAVRKLPTRDRKLFCRLHFAAVTWPQLARDGGCSVATIMRRVRRARARFERLALRDPNLSALVQRRGASVSIE